MKGIIPLEIFDLEVAVFESDEARVAELKAQGCEDVDEHDRAALASSHIDFTGSGEPRLSMVIKPVATRATRAHECSHIADFVCDLLGIPISLENTEVRSYLIGHMFAYLEGMFE